MNKIFRRFSYPYIIWVILAIIVPLLLVVYYSFIDKSGTLTLANFQQVLTPQNYLIFIRSLTIALFTTIICLCIGYPTALFLSRIDRRYQKFLLFLFILPTWTNIILRTYAWLVLFYKNGIMENILAFFNINVSLQYSTFAVYLGMVYNFLPFMILPLYTAIDKIDHSLLEASQDLGANNWQRFRTVIFPLTLPGIISGIILVFLPAATTFVIPQLLSGAKYNLIGNVIERQFLAADNMNFGSALSIILMILILLSILMLNIFDKNSQERDV